MIYTINCVYCTHEELKINNDSQRAFCILSKKKNSLPCFDFTAQGTCMHASLCQHWSRHWEARQLSINLFVLLKKATFHKIHTRDIPNRV